MDPDDMIVTTYKFHDIIVQMFQCASHWYNLLNLPDSLLEFTPVKHEKCYLLCGIFKKICVCLCDLKITLQTVETESLLKPILSADEVPGSNSNCVYFS